ncbi:MAG: universal stress protein [Woeseiaceae bacterium]|nr:universal stress protein [Woeseiaceae bacterium]
MTNRKRILVVVQQQPGSERAIDHALAMARQSDADLTVIDVYSYLDAYTKALSDVIDGSELRQLVLEHRKDHLKRYLASRDDEKARTAEVKVLDGVPFVEIIREAVNTGCELTVKVSDREGGSRNRNFGSTDMHLIRKSPIPVWTINAARKDTARRVLATVDPLAMDDESRDLHRKTLKVAAELAEMTNARLLVLSTWQLIGEESMRNSPFLKIDDARIDSLVDETDNRARNAQSLLARWFEREVPHATIPNWHVIKGTARQVIPDFVEAHDIELLVMGSVARADIPGLLIGSTAESVLGDINCSVLTVKPDGFVSPIALDQTGLDPAAPDEEEDAPPVAHAAA